MVVGGVCGGEVGEVGTLGGGELLAFGCWILLIWSFW